MTIPIPVSQKQGRPSLIPAVMQGATTALVKGSSTAVNVLTWTGLQSGDEVGLLRVGKQWVAIPTAAAPKWQSFTPVWTNWNLGSGATNIGRYIQIGKKVHLKIQVTPKTGTSFGSGQVTVALPINAAANGMETEGLVKIYMADGATNYMGVAFIGSGGSFITFLLPKSSTTSALAVMNSSSGATVVPPANGNLEVSIDYEVA